MSGATLDLETLPFPVAYPLSYARDETLGVSDRVDNVFFGGYQAVRTTALLLLADYLESSETCPRVSEAIRGLRLPHWKEWVELATTLAKFWKGHYDQRPERETRFPALVTAWLETAVPRQARTDGDWPTLLDRCPGGNGPAKGPVDALWSARNKRTHGTGTRTGDPTRDATLLARHLPLLEALTAALFPPGAFTLLRRVSTEDDEGLRVIRLHGPHRDRRFEAEELGEEWASAFETTGIAALAEGEALVVHPLFLPPDPDLRGGPVEGGGLLEDLYLVDRVSERKVVALGVLDEMRLPESGIAEVTAALRRKQVELGLDREATRRWNLVDWSASTAGRLLADLTNRKYFPDFYYERPDVDATLRRTLELESAPETSSASASEPFPARGRALLLLGEAGSGKSSLLSRLVDGLLRRQADEEPETEQKPDRPKKAARAGGSADLSRYIEGRGRGDVVLYLAGAAAYGGDAGTGADALLCDAVVRQGGVLTGAFPTLEHFVTKLDESSQKTGPNADRNPDRKVWIVLDGINEADRFKDLVGALDRFLPHVARRPWLRLVVSIRSGAYHELERKDRAAMVHEGAVFRNASCWASFPGERPDAFGRKQDVPYLEVRPFTAGREGAEAYRLRQAWQGGKRSEIRYEDLPPGVKTLLLSPLHLHLFHETWAGQARVPVDLVEKGLLEAFLTKLTKEHPGLRERLQLLAEVMLERREALLPIEVAEKWEEESGRQAGTMAARLAKLTPVEELVAASILMRPVEEGQGSQRKLIGYRFSHQSLASAVLARQLRARLNGRDLPTSEELLDWARRASGGVREGQEPFEELVDAVATFVVACTTAGDGEAVAALLDLERDRVRNGLMNVGLVAYGPLRGPAAEPGELPRRFWETFAHTSRIGVRAARLDDAVWEPQDANVRNGYSRAAADIGELRVEQLRGLSSRDSSRLDWKRDLTVSLNRLSTLRANAGQGLEAERLAEEALALTRELVAAEPERLDWKLDLAVSLNRLGDFRANAGRGPEAERLSEESLALMRELVAAELERLDWKRELTVSLSQLSELRANTGRGPEAERLSEESLALMRELVAAEPERLDLKRDLTVSLGRLSVLRANAGRGPEAERLSEESLALMRELVAAEPERLDLKRDLTVSLGRLSVLRANAGRGPEAERLLEEDLALMRELVKVEPGRMDWTLDLSASLAWLSDLRAKAGRGPEAERLAEEDLALTRELVAAEPKRLDWKQGLSVSLNRLSALHAKTGRGPEAETLAEEDLALTRELVAAEPGRLDWKLNLVASLRWLSGLHERASRGQEAERLSEESLPLMRELVAAEPGRLDWKQDLAVSLNWLSDLRARASRGQEAERLSEESLPLMRELVAAEPGRLDWKQDLAVSLIRLSDLRANTGRGPEADGLSEESLALMRDLVAAEPGRLDWKRDLTLSLSRLSGLRARAGQGPEAERLAEEDLALTRELVAAEPGMLDWRRDLAVSLGRLSGLRARAGQGPEAERLAEEDLALTRELVAAEPGRLDWKWDLALSLVRLSDIRASTGRGLEAEGLSEESLVLMRKLVAAEPERLDWKRDLTVTLNRLSALHLARGAAGAAEALAQESLELRRMLHEQDPEAPETTYGLMVGFDALARVQIATGMSKEARQCLVEAEALRGSLPEEFMALPHRQLEGARILALRATLEPDSLETVEWLAAARKIVTEQEGKGDTVLKMRNVNDDLRIADEAVATVRGRRLEGAQ